MEWIMLKFPNKTTVNTIYLYDEGDPSNQIVSGELKFSDGSLVTIAGGLNNDGALGIRMCLFNQIDSTTTWLGSATIVQFSTVFDILSVNFTITGVSATTSNAGLSEMQVYFNER
jgi:hypothetical protein